MLTSGPLMALLGFQWLVIGSLIMLLFQAFLSAVSSSNIVLWYVFSGVQWSGSLDQRLYQPL